MNYRMPSNATTNRVTTDMSRAYRRFTDIQNQVATGKRLSKPSDDPTAIASSLSGRANQRRLEQYATNATDATGWLKVTDSTLMDLQEQLNLAKTRATAAVSGANDTASREAIASDILQLRSAMIQMANQTYQGRSVFSGTTAMGVAPYDQSGVYQGDAGDVTRLVDDGLALRINVTGPEVFGTANAGTPLAGDVFQVLDELAKSVRANDATAVGAANTAIDQARDHMGIAQIHIGETEALIDSTLARNETVRYDVKARLSQIEDVDLAEAIISMKAHEVGYQAALGVTAKVIQPSLLDYLR